MPKGPATFNLCTMRNECEVYPWTIIKTLHQLYQQMLPFVRIEVEGVCPLNTVQDWPVFWTDECASSIGGINVEPDVLNRVVISFD